MKLSEKVLAAVCIAILLLAGYILASATPCEPPASGDTPAVTAPTNDDLCRRYHNQSRTTNFFKRSKRVG